MAKLVGEVEYLRQMTEMMKRMVMGHGLEEKGGEREGIKWQDWKKRKKRRRRRSAKKW